MDPRYLNEGVMMAKVTDEEIRAKLSEVSDGVDASLQKYLKDDQLQNIVNILLYEQQTSGKRLRPALATFVAQTLGGDFDKTVDIASACELLHSASLMLDDAIDGDESRRGNPAVHVAFGGGMAMMGTYIQAMIGLEMGILTDVDIGQLLIHTVRRLVVGATDEMSWNDWDPDNYFKVIDNKTAALFEAPCLIGVITSGKKKTHYTLGKQYGNCLGILYQLCDDYVDVAKSINLSEPVGDIKVRNTTIPIIHAYEHTGKAEIKMLLQLYRKKVDLPDSHLRMIINELAQCESLEYLHGIVEQYKNKAIELAQQFPDNEHRAYLESLPEYMQRAQFDEIDMPNFNG